VTVRGSFPDPTSEPWTDEDVKGSEDDIAGALKFILGLTDYDQFEVEVTTTELPDGD